VPQSFVTRTIAKTAAKAPGLKKLPMLKLLAAAEVVVLTRDHIQRLTPDERHRAVELIRAAHGRPRNLSGAEREELAALVAKAEPRLLAGEAAEAFSPVPLPKRFVTGRRHR
jgi:hypothetical protein